MTAISPRILDGLIGKPFKAGGRGPDAFDCVGLAVEVQRRRGLPQPPFLSDEVELHRQLAAGGALCDAQRLETAEPGCFVLLRSFEEGHHHIGIMIDRFTMLHCRREIGVAREVLARSLWARRVIGFYRPEAQA